MKTNQKQKKIKLFDPVYMEALELVSKIHDSFRKDIDINIQDKRLAIYYLQGGCITHAYLAIHHWLAKDLGAPLVHKRIIDESKNAALFLSAVDNNHRYIKSFFEKKIISMPKKILETGKYEIEADYILRKLNWTKDHFEKYMENSKKLESGFSNAVHAQIETVAFNSDRFTGEFDYDFSKDFNDLFIRNFDFGHYIIIPTMDSILFNVDIFPIPDKYLKDFTNMREKVSSTGLEIFENLRDSNLNNYEN